MNTMSIQSEPIGSIPRPVELILGMKAHAVSQMNDRDLQHLYDEAVSETIKNFEATGSPVITDGEQAKPSFATYPIQGLQNLSPGGVVIPFADGHLKKAKQLTALPVKQAVISASAISLLYPLDGIDGYSHEQFLNDLVNE